MGFAGATGMDYASCIATLTLYLPRWQREAAATDPVQEMEVVDLLDDMRTVELVMLEVAAERAETERDKTRRETP